MIDPTPWMRAAVGGPLHPGGEAATRDLLAAADVGTGTRLVDLGCGAGDAVALAEALGADAVGLDRDGPVVGDLTRLPFADAAFDVVLSECAICLADDLDAALSEARRVLAPGGRLAVSDVTLERDLDVPPILARPLCLATARPRDRLVARIEAAGLDVVHVRDRSGDLAEMRDRIRSRVDVDGLLGALGDAAGPLGDGVDAIEEALADGVLGYVHVVARR